MKPSLKVVNENKINSVLKCCLNAKLFSFTLKVCGKVKTKYRFRHFSYFIGDIERVKGLLDSRSFGVDVDDEDENGRTPLKFIQK